MPQVHNKVTLNTQIRDEWGLPTLDIDCAFGPNEDAMDKDIAQTMREMMEAAGFRDINVWNSGAPPGGASTRSARRAWGETPKQAC